MPASFNAGQEEEVLRLLQSLPVIQDRCALDVLIFLHRHPRTLLSSESLSRFVGYDIKDIAKVLDAFITAAVLERIALQTRHAARMFVLRLDGPQGPGLRRLLEWVSTREGRLHLIELLNDSQSRHETMRCTVNLRVEKQKHP